MKLHNNTHWSTKDLKRIAARVVREEFPRDRFDDRAKRYVVQVVYAHNRANGTCSGYAYYHSNSCTVRVPSGYVDTVDFAYVVGHECGHSKGLKHGRMAPHHEHRTDYALKHYEWAKRLTVSRKVVKVKERPSYDKKLQHALAMVRRSETKVKRAATILKKWQQKARYYEKQAGRKAACSGGAQ